MEKALSTPTHPELTDEEYVQELERMVKTHLTADGYEWFYYDVLLDETEKCRLAYARATGDTRYLELEEDE